MDISVEAFGDADVVHTFDDDVPPPVAGPPGHWASNADFALVDAQGT